MTSNPVGLRSPVGGGSPDGLPGVLSPGGPGGGINGNLVIAWKKKFPYGPIFNF